MTLSAAEESATQPGLVWFWAFVTFFAVPYHERTHGFLTVLILTAASTAYFTMAIDRGYTNAYVDAHVQTTTRTIYWARYVDWFVTTPLLLLEVLLYSGLPIFTSLWIIGADIAMILLGLFAALESSYQGFRWGYYGVSVTMQLIIVNGLYSGFRTVKLRDPRIRTVYIIAASYLGILWLGYPIVFGLAEGSNTISVFKEIGCYSVLDLLTKVVFGFGLLAGTFYLRGAYQAEYKGGKYLPDSTGAPIYAPLSVTRDMEEQPTQGIRPQSYNTSANSHPAVHQSAAVPVQTTTTVTTHENGRQVV